MLSSGSTCQPDRDAGRVIPPAFRKVFALSPAPVNRQASFFNRDVVRNTGARYGETKTAAGR
jgi:hypothetical protein